MHQDLPSHISELISLLKSVSDPELVLMSYIKHLPCDPYLYSTFMSLSYNPSKGEFDDLPRTERIVSALQTEYSSLPLPCKRSYSDLSETSSDKARCSKGLKVLSARVKSILLSKRLNSYREVAQELIKELNIVSKTEEKNILRRVYDALNVLIAAGAVAKNGNEYEWVECVEPENEILKEKRLKLKALKEKLTAAQGLMKRNKQEEKSESRLRFPLFFVATEELGNNVVIESNKERSIVRVKFRKEMKIFRDFDVVPKVLDGIA